MELRGEFTKETGEVSGFRIFSGDFHLVKNCKKRERVGALR